MAANKRLLVVAQEKYFEIASGIAKATQDFSIIEWCKDINRVSKDEPLNFDHILLVGTVEEVEHWSELLQDVERKLLFLSLTTSSGMAYKVKIKQKMPEDYKFDEVM